MLTHTLIFALAVTLSLVTANPTASRQARRYEIAARQHDRRVHALMPRSSPATCAVKDDYNNCCDSSGTMSISGVVCCSNAVFDSDCGSTSVCCPGGASQIASGPAGLGSMCCAAGTRPISSDNFNTAPTCQVTTRKRHPLALELATRPVKRGTFDDPSRQISFRDDSWRARLSPQLYADFLVNDFEVSYRDHTLIDHHARASGGRSFRAIKLQEDPAFTIKKAPGIIGDYLAKSYESGQRYLDLYKDWEIHFDDFPATYRAIVEHPRFGGRIHLHGQYYDEETLRTIYTKFPTWNATLHDRRVQ